MCTFAILLIFPSIINKNIAHLEYQVAHLGKCKSQFAHDSKFRGYNTLILGKMHIRESSGNPDAHF